MTNRLKKLLKTPKEEWYEGKLTRHDHFDAIRVIDDALNQVPIEIAVENRRQFMASCFGHFMTIHGRMKFLGGVIHRLLLREVHHTGPSDEMHFMLRNQEILRGLDERVKILVWQFRLMVDLDDFEVFPWGAHMYNHLIFLFKHALDGRREWFERRQQKKGADVHMSETYNIYGLSYALLMFLRTELVPIEAERGESYYTAIEEALPDSVSAKLSDIKGSEPEHRCGSEQMHLDK
ncbi:hypothetical protein Ddye_026201 [Dipteronia dyeriana]|uniref:Uncharacterized protein n=1 Tax=Dipteronia dyeriana TaxID=168575 RepID=A0AAD9TMA2_9ROSI|nr:hypothetical protein Ddye_026201 [Dipteronia dyeriana]